MKRLVTFFLALCCTVWCSGKGFLTDVSGNNRVPVAIHVNSQRLQFQIQGKYQVDGKDVQVINLPMAGLGLSFSEGSNSPLKELLVKDLDGDEQHHVLCTAWQRSKSINIALNILSLAISLFIVIQMKLKHTLMVSKNLEQAKMDLLDSDQSSNETRSKTESSENSELKRWDAGLQTRKRVLESIPEAYTVPPENSRTQASTEKPEEQPKIKAEGESLEQRITGMLVDGGVQVKSPDSIARIPNTSLEDNIARILNGESFVGTVPEPTKTEAHTRSSSSTKVSFYQDKSESPSLTGSDSETAPVDIPTVTVTPQVSNKPEGLANENVNEQSLEKLVEAAAQKTDGAVKDDNHKTPNETAATLRKFVEAAVQMTEEAVEERLQEPPAEASTTTESPTATSVAETKEPLAEAEIEKSQAEPTNVKGAEIQAMSVAAVPGEKVPEENPVSVAREKKLSELKTEEEDAIAIEDQTENAPANLISQPVAFPEPAEDRREDAKPRENEIDPIKPFNSPEPKDEVVEELYAETEGPSLSPVVIQEPVIEDKKDAEIAPTVSEIAETSDANPQSDAKESVDIDSVRDSENARYEAIPDTQDVAAVPMDEQKIETVESSASEPSIGDAKVVLQEADAAEEQSVPTAEIQCEDEQPNEGEDVDAEEHIHQETVPEEPAVAQNTTAEESGEPASETKAEEKSAEQPASAEATGTGELEQPCSKSLDSQAEVQSVVGQPLPQETAEDPVFQEESNEKQRIAANATEESKQEEKIVEQPSSEPEPIEVPSVLFPASVEQRENTSPPFERLDAELEPSNGAAKFVAVAKMVVVLQSVRTEGKLLEEEQSRRAQNQERIDKIVESIEVIDEYRNDIAVPQGVADLVFEHARVDETGDLRVLSGATTYSAGFWATITASRLETEWNRHLRDTSSVKYSKARFVQWRPQKDDCFTPTKLNDPNAVYHILGHDDRKLQLFPGVRLALSEMAENCYPTSSHGTMMWNEKKTGFVLKADAGISRQKESLSTFMQWLQSKAPIDYFEQAQIGEDANQKASVIIHAPSLTVDEIDKCVDLSVYYATIYKQVFMTVATRANAPSTIYLSVGKEMADKKLMIAAAFEAYMEFASKLKGADVVFVPE